MKIWLMIILLSSAACGIFLFNRRETPTPTAPIKSQNSDVSSALEISNKFLIDLKNKNFESAAKHISVLGMVFSPNYVPTKVGTNETRLVKYTGNNFGNFKNEQEKKTWGYYDGSGKPIELTNSEYYDAFIYNDDFINKAFPSVDIQKSQSNSIPLKDIASSIGDNVVFVEYYIPGSDPKYDGMDWKGLTIFLRKENDIWKVVGLMHGAWSI